MSAFTNGGDNTAGAPDQAGVDQKHQDTVKRTQEADIDEQTRKELLASLQRYTGSRTDLEEVVSRLDAAITNTGPESQLFKERKSKQLQSQRIVSTPGLRAQTTGSGTALTSEYRKADNDSITLIGGR